MQPCFQTLRKHLKNNIQCFQQDPAPAGALAGSLLRFASCVPAFPTRGKGPFYQLRRVLAKGRHLLQILLKALNISRSIFGKLQDHGASEEPKESTLEVDSLEPLMHHDPQDL